MRAGRRAFARPVIFAPPFEQRLVKKNSPISGHSVRFLAGTDAAHTNRGTMPPHAERASRRRVNQLLRAGRRPKAAAEEAAKQADSRRPPVRRNRREGAAFLARRSQARGAAPTEGPRGTRFKRGWGSPPRSGGERDLGRIAFRGKDTNATSPGRQGFKANSREIVLAEHNSRLYTERSVATRSVATRPLSNAFPSASLRKNTKTGRPNS